MRTGPETKEVSPCKSRKHDAKVEQVMLNSDLMTSLSPESKYPPAEPDINAGAKIDRIASRGRGDAAE